MLRALLLVAVLLTPVAAARADALVERGAYLAAAAGCRGCHTAKDGAAFGGGRALPTPMGTFFAPNITADAQHGIGAWTEAEFIAALRQGMRRDGAHLYPAFPYTSYTRMTDEDARAIRIFLLSLPASATPNRAHEMKFPFSLRPLLWFWKQMNFRPGVFQPDAAKPEAWNRGAYLVEALGHCGECHTPRGRLGGLDRSLAYAGTGSGPEGKRVPNITPHRTGIGGWSESDIAYFLDTGLLPDGDATGELMDEVVRDGTSKLTDADRRAIAVYLMDLKPIDHKPVKPAAKQ